MARHYKFWIHGHFDSVGSDPNNDVALENPRNRHPIDEKAWRELLEAQDNHTSREELLTLMNAIDDLRNPA